MRFLLLLLACWLSTAGHAQVTRSGNPLFEGWYADPEAVVVDGRCWIFPTWSAPYDEQLFFDAFSSADLVHWQKHPRVLTSSQVSWARRAMWAPSVVEHAGRYYLFFSANDVHEGEVGGIGVAVSERPDGPYRDVLGHPLVQHIVNGAQPIDQHVFRDDDGQYYMYYGGWGHCNVVRLADDLMSLVPFADGETYKEITPEHYVEGPFMLKRQGKYYFMWSEGGWGLPNYCVSYAVGDSPTGPFRRIGKILEQDPLVATSAGHHSVVRGRGADEWYIVYHRRPLGLSAANSRVTCIDRLQFDASGNILPVRMTHDGVGATTFPSPKSRWRVVGPHAIRWETTRGALPHADHIEMSGLRTSVVYYWEVDERGAFHMDRHLVFPMLRTIPDNTGASWMPRSDVDFLRGMTADGHVVGDERVQSVTIDGVLRVTSTVGSRQSRYTLQRAYYLSPTHAAVCEQYRLTNTGEATETIVVPAIRHQWTTRRDHGTRGSYRLVAQTAFQEDLTVTLAPGQTAVFYATIQAYAPADEHEAELNAAEELSRRVAFVGEVAERRLRFTCPDTTITTLFAMSKLRASESIFHTPVGLMHSPGGEAYYAAMWCNDQAEYVNPFFPFLGYDKGNESALTTWKCYLKQTNADYRFVPWSIICGGNDSFGMFDRGDAAMLAYGASRYCLERGDEEIARRVWPLIEWCLEYCRRRINEHGVVASEGDELEHQLPSGDANLCTSSLYYDALLSSAWLAEAMGRSGSEAATFRQQAAELRQHIDQHFHATVEGYDTYRYYEGNDVLRSWICIPLTMGIYDRAAGTLQAMFSPQLWTENGMLSQSGDKIFWDRTTLYGLRGAFAAGYADRALEFLQKFSTIRLLGEHVPYVVEAWPEGSQRHLSAESGLFCRIITEGLLGFRPTGFRSFTLTPQMPAGWNEYSLGSVYACTDAPLDIHVYRTRGSRLSVKIMKNGRPFKTMTVKPGETVRVGKY